jgi:hypothetical protein
MLQLLKGYSSHPIWKSMVTVHPLHDIWEKVSTLGGKDTAISVSSVEKIMALLFF